MARSLARTNFVLWGWSSPKGFSWLILVIFRAIFSPNLTTFGETFGEELNRHAGKWARLSVRQTWPLWRRTLARIALGPLRLELAKTFAKLNHFGEKIDLFGENLKKFGEELWWERARFLAVGIRQSIRQTFLSLARNMHDSLRLEFAKEF